MLNLLNKSTNVFRYEINTEYYALKVINRTLYDLSSKYEIDFNIKNSTKNQLELRIKNNSMNNIESVNSDFLKLILDHKIRDELEKEHKVLRQLTVAQAFQPCENLNDIVDIIKK